MRRVTLIAAVVAVTASATRAVPPRLPSGPIPDGLGVNIHFTNPQPGEMAMLAGGGFTWVRMDFDWNQVEYEKGKYRFDAYDRLMKALEEHRIRPIFILDYVHRLYDDAQSPHSDEAIAAFARFAAASAKHFQGRGILWEMYNEPNILPFWRPRVNVDDYVRLAAATGKAIRAVAPKEAYIGPGTSTIDFRFLEACFKGGLLKFWDAVSVHPYRSSGPETVIPEYARLRDLIRRHAPRGKRVPIISGEWGYSSAWAGMDAERQAKMLARQWLTNLSCDIPLSIWYDWHDDGPDPREPEHHFGTTLHPTMPDRTPIYDPKPAYIAAQTLTAQLRGLRFNKRLVMPDPRAHVLLFGTGAQVRVVAWSVSREPLEVTIPAGPGTLECVDHLGKSLPPVAVASGGAAVKLSDAPVYLRPVGRNRVLERIADWPRLPQDTPVAWAPTVTVRVGRSAAAVTRTIKLDRSPVAVPVRLSLTIRGVAPVVQETRIVVTDPLSITINPPIRGAVPIEVENPAGRPFAGILRARIGREGRIRTARLPLRFTQGALRSRLSIPAPGTSPRLTVQAAVLDPKGSSVLSVPEIAFLTVDDFGRFPLGAVPSDYRVYPDGDPNVPSEQTISVQDPPTGPTNPGLRSLRLTYRYSRGWKFVCVRPETESLRKIAGKPREFGLWICGDAKGNVPRIRFVDSTGQTIQPDGTPIDWTGWKWVTFPMDGTRSGHWGGADDGVVHYPIRWDTLFLLDSPGGRATAGEVYIAAPTLIY